MEDWYNESRSKIYERGVQYTGVLTWRGFIVILIKVPDLYLCYYLGVIKLILILIRSDNWEQSKHEHADLWIKW